MPTFTRDSVVWYFICVDTNRSVVFVLDPLYIIFHFCSIYFYNAGVTATAASCINLAFFIIKFLTPVPHVKCIIRSHSSFNARFWSNKNVHSAVYLILLLCCDCLNVFVPTSRHSAELYKTKRQTIVSMFKGQRWLISDGQKQITRFTQHHRCSHSAVYMGWVLFTKCISSTCDHFSGWFQHFCLNTLISQLHLTK